MLARSVLRRAPSPRARLTQMANHTTSANGHTNGTNGTSTGYAFADLPKSSNFTSKLPADSEFPTPESSHSAPRQKLGPRLVRNALYTYVRPVPTETSELLGMSSTALKDLGLKESESTSQELKDVVSGNKILWDEEKGGVYPWAQCYGGFQFGQWAGQLGDGRAISLFETTNPTTQKRYEVQLKGAGKTPYSRFADGKAVLRSSIREYVVSEHLNALGIPSTRALSLTLNPDDKVVRERLEPGAIVCRFAESWLRIGTFDLMRSRGDRSLIRKTATYIAEEVFPGWESLPSALPNPKEPKEKDSHIDPTRGVSSTEIQGASGAEENRFTRLYREIVRRNALTVAKWQAYGFMNGVLNTDNTSIFGLSLDFGPFAFMDNFDPSYTPNHDDHMLRYSYRAQPTIIWWNLVRLGESLGELIGAGDHVDDTTFIEKGVTEDFAEILVKRAETIIDQVGEEFKAVFLSEYHRLMTARLGLKTFKESDFDSLFSELLDMMEALELDFNHFFRRLGTVKVGEIDTPEKRESVAKRFFHAEGVTGLNENEETGKHKVGEWLEAWRKRVVEDWGSDDSQDSTTPSSSSSDAERQKAMDKVNPNFIARGWLLDEVIDRVQNKGDRDILGGVMRMALNPFEESWGWNEKDEKRFVGDVPRFKRLQQCSCSS